MPKKVDSIPINNPKFDKRVKLSNAQKEQIRQEYNRGDTSYNKLAQKYGVSKRLIIFIVNPEKLAVAKKTYKQRAKDGRYYNKEKHAAYMKKHREYKDELFKRGDLNI